MQEIIQFFQGKGELSATALNVVAGLAISWGLVNCFFGHRIFKIVLGIAGFAVGMSIGAGVGAQMGEGQQVWVLVGSLIGGLAGSLLIIWLHVVGVFLAGAALGAIVGGAAATAMKVQGLTALAVVVVPALLLGVVALMLQKLLIIVATSFGGASIAVVGALQVIKKEGPLRLANDPQAMQAYLRVEGATVAGAWLILGFVGVLVQYLFTARKAVEIVGKHDD